MHLYGKNSLLEKDYHPALQMMRRISLATILILFVTTRFLYALPQESRNEWTEYKSVHFIIYHHPSIPHSYVAKFAKKCETYYNVITDRLGFARYDFWLWKDRAKIFIYKTREDYLANTGQPEWSGAATHIQKKFINTFHFHKEFFDNILPHEVSHIILREFIGLDTPAPLWFDEGVACANEKDSRAKYLLFAKRLIAQGKEVSVESDDPEVFYAASSSLITFLLDAYKRSRFVEFCRELRDGTDFDTAMAMIYKIKDANELNSKFLFYLKNSLKIN